MEIFLTILAHLPFALGLFLTAKHMENPFWYFAFIPLLQIVLFFKLAWYNIIMMILLFVLTIFSMKAWYWEIGVYLLFYMLTFQTWVKSWFWSTKSLWVALIPVLWILIIWWTHYLNEKNKIKNNEKNRSKRVEQLKKERVNSDSLNDSNVIDEVLSITCNNCKKPLKVKKSLAIKAKKWKCPNCKNIINLI